MKFKIIAYFVLITSLLSSCGQKFDDFVLEEGKSYFPLIVGLNITYVVDSTIYDPFQQDIFNKRFYVREYIESSYEDDAGNTNYRLERYIGENEDDINTISSVWYISTGSKFIDRTEENLRFRKFVLPVRDNANWMAHKFLVAEDKLSFLKNWRYTFLNTNKPYLLADEEFGDKSYDSTVTVRQFGDSTNIIQTMGKEVYAKDIGLIYKKMTYLDGSTPCRRLCPEQSETCVNNCFTLPLIVRADNGFIVTIRYLKHEILL